MVRGMEQFTARQIKDLKVLASFVATFCRARHAIQREFPLMEEVAGMFTRPLLLCPDCGDLLAHAIEKRRMCPLDPKPSCKHCHIHCYSKEYRARVREIMAFSGRRMILRGRIDYLWHYFF